MNKENEKIVREFIKTLENRQHADELLEFYHSEVEQIEFPNTLTKNKAVRNLNDLLDGAEKGKKVLQKEQYEILNLYTSGNTVILEAEWTGTLAIPIGNIPVGGLMKAYFAQFFEFRDGLIYRQRNYDCFEPFQ